MSLSREAEAAAFETLKASPQFESIVAVVRGALAPTLESRRLAWPTSTSVVSLGERYQLGARSKTSFGDMFEVLMRPPESEPEAALGRALFASLLSSECAHEDGSDESALALLAEDVLFMAAHTPFNALGLLDTACGPCAAPIWSALVKLVRDIDAGRAGTFDMSDALFAASAFAESSWPDAPTELLRLADSVADRSLERELRTSASRAAPVAVQGTLLPPERPFGITLLLGATGVLAAMHIARSVARLGFGAKTDVDLLLDTRGVLLTCSRSLLGRVVARSDARFPETAFIRMSRETREPRLGLYAAIATFGIGSYLGMSLLADGVRAASPLLLARGLLVVGIGLLLELLLSRVIPAARQMRILTLVLRDRQTIRIGVDDGKAVETLFERFLEPS